MHGLVDAIDNWVKEHPYLNEIAEVQKVIASVSEEKVVRVRTATEMDPGWDTVASQMARGIPALRAVENYELIVKEASVLLTEMAKALAGARLPLKMAEQCRNFNLLLQEDSQLQGWIIEQALESSSVLSHKLETAGILEGFALFLAWSALAAALRPLKARVKVMQKEIKWRRAYCPVCGQLPGMGQLVRARRRGREKLLVCSCCQMKWPYKRIGCPFCGNEDQKTLSIIEIEKAPDLRIDTCEKCKGYIKVYTSEGNEQVALADWSTLHLDLIAKSHGFQRMGYRLYEV